MEKEYEPFGAEWEAEMMKLPKQALVDMIKKFSGIDGEWIGYVLKEVQRAESKHPKWPEDKIYAMAIIGEEYGEAQREAVKIEMDEDDASPANLEKEVIQTAATCIRLLKNL